MSGEPGTQRNAEAWVHAQRWAEMAEAALEACEAALGRIAEPAFGPGDADATEALQAVREHRATLVLIRDAMVRVQGIDR